MKIPNFFKLRARANASLARDIEKELKVPDPELEKSQAILEGERNESEDDSDDTASS